MIYGVPKKKLLIIIPAYNEGKNIGTLIDSLKLPPIADIADVLVMNDASGDDTEAVVRARGIDIVTHVYNLGYGSGLQVGYRYAYKHNYKFVIQMDGDGQHDISNILKIYDRLNQCDENGQYPDIVLGSRFIDSWKDYPTSAIKKFAYKLFGLMIRVATGRKITDPTTGLQGLSRRTIEYYSEFGHFDDKYPDANMIMQMILLGFNVIEIKALMHRRVSGKSMHSGLKPVVYMFRMTWSIMAVWVRIKLFKEKAVIG